MSELSNLLAELDAKTFPGASEAALAAFEIETGLRLPAAVRTLYAASDGLTLGSRPLRFLPLAEVQDYSAAMQEIGIPARWGYFPLIDDDDSNPYCVCCHGPLAGYVVQVFHDDAAALKFRSLESFLAALAGGGAAGGRDLYEMPPDFVGPARTAADSAAGQELLNLAPGLEEVEQADAYRFGLWLLSEDQIDEIVAVLEAGDEYVHEDALARLAVIGTPGAQAAIRASKADLARFVARCADALHQAGVEATIEGSTGLSAGPRRAGINTAMFYARRREPDIFEKLIERFRDG